MEDKNGERTPENSSAKKYQKGGRVREKKAHDRPLAKSNANGAGKTGRKIAATFLKLTSLFGFGTVLLVHFG